MPQIETHETHRPQPSTPIAYIGGRLAVDTDAARRHLFTALGCEPAAAAGFTRAWQSRAWLFVHHAGQTLTGKHFSGLFPPDGLSRVRRDLPFAFVADIQAAGVRAELETVHFDSAEARYVDADRVVQVLRLHEAAGFTEVAWPACPEASFGLAKPDPDAAKVLTGWVFQPGTYLLVWRFPWNRPVLHGAARIDFEPASADIAELPGFQARRLNATCDQCDRRWTAYHGELTFDAPTGPGWQFESPAVRTGSAVQCPRAGCAGLVHLRN